MSNRDDAPGLAPKRQGNDAFFIGYAGVPAGLRTWLIGIAGLLLAAFAAGSVLLAATQNDPGPGAFQWDAGVQTVTGVIETRPYPVLHASPSAAFPQGHGYLLSGDGKRGVQGAAGPLDGQLVEARGFLIKRGSLDMLQLGGDDGLRLSPTLNVTPARAPAPVDLGRWRIKGEICDGKCAAGAMRPGTGLAHKACANLCLIGGAPPVLVTAAPVAGSSFFLLGGPAGEPLPARILDYVAVPIEVEGRIERRGDLTVFKLDPATLRVP